MSGLPERLADLAWDDCRHDVTGGLCAECCAAAIRAALDEAAEVARAHDAVCAAATECAEMVATAIEALK